jgi:hypothetical protein
MQRAMIACAALAALGLAATGASAAAPASNSMASHSAMSAMAPHSAMASMASSHMASSAGHAKETKMDVMMVNQCHAMPRKKMLKDAECQDYMKHHPDWMKGK